MSNRGRHTHDCRQVFGVRGAKIRLAKSAQFDTLERHISSDFINVQRGYELLMDAGPGLNSDIWVDQYGNALFRFAVVRVKDRGIAEDLVQETFLAGLQSRDRFRGQSSEKTWLFSILKHKIIDYFRKNKSNGFGKEILHDADSMETFFNSKGGWQIRPQHWHTDPGKNQEIKEFLDHFYECLTDLPHRNADAFVYREIDGLSTKAICKLLDISATNCWVMLYRARMSLRRCLELAGFIPPNARGPK